MFRMLNKEARAPLAAVQKAIRRYKCTAPTNLSEYELDRNIIKILHQHNWRKCAYVHELRSRARRARKLQFTMCKRPFAP